MAGEKIELTQDELDAKIAEAVGGLKSNRDEVLREAKALKTKLASYEGIDVDEVKTLKQQAEDAARNKAAGEGNWKALEEQLKTRHGQEVEKLSSESKRLRGALERQLIDAAASQEIASMKGSVKGLLPHIRPHIKVMEQDGEFVAVVVDSKGNPRIGDAKGSPMSIRDLIEETRGDTDLAPLFAGSGASGSGAAKSNAGGGGSKVVAAGDGAGFMANLEGIAKGTVEVR